MSRPGAGPAMVNGLAGSDDARQRAKLILQTMDGGSVNEAAEILGVSPQRFHELRAEALAALVAACEPKPLGRPVREPTLEERVAAAVAQLQAANNDLRVELEIARLREELIAAGMYERMRPKPKKNGRRKR